MVHTYTDIVLHIVRALVCLILNALDLQPPVQPAVLLQLSSPHLFTQTILLPGGLAPQTSNHSSVHSVAPATQNCLRKRIKWSMLILFHNICKLLPISSKPPFRLHTFYQRWTGKNSVSSPFS